MHSYWMNDWPLWLFLYFKTQFWASQMHPLTIQILVGWSAPLIIPAFQYWVLCQPNLCIHFSDTGWVIGHYHYSCISILSFELAKCIHSSFKYWFDDQLLWLFLHSNIGFFVSPIYSFTILILNEWLATMIIPVFQSPKCIHSAFKYWFGDKLLWLFLHSNIGFCVSLMYAFILDEWLATMIIPLFQYWVPS